MGKKSKRNAKTAESSQPPSNNFDYHQDKFDSTYRITNTLGRSIGTDEDCKMFGFKDNLGNKVDLYCPHGTTIAGVIPLVDENGVKRKVSHSAWNLHLTNLSVWYMDDDKRSGPSEVTFDIDGNEERGNEEQNQRRAAGLKTRVVPEVEVEKMYNNNKWRIHSDTDTPAAHNFLKLLIRAGLIIFHYPWDDEELKTAWSAAVQNKLFAQVQNKEEKNNYSTGGPTHGERAYDEMKKTHCIQQKYQMPLRCV
jgi:hypothetical protein